MRTIKHPDFEPGAPSTVDNAINGLCRRIVTVTCTNVEYVGNDLSQAMTAWMLDGGEVPVLQVTQTG